MQKFMNNSSDLFQAFWCLKASNVRFAIITNMGRASIIIFEYYKRFGRSSSPFLETDASHIVKLSKGFFENVLFFVRIRPGKFIINKTFRPSLASVYCRLKSLKIAFCEVFVPFFRFIVHRRQKAAQELFFDIILIINFLTVFLPKLCVLGDWQGCKNNPNAYKMAQTKHITKLN